MSTTTRMEQHETAIMEPMMDGTFEECALALTHLWRCDGCGLCWEKRWHAETCQKRGHVDHFDQGPYGVAMVLNGVPQPWPGCTLRYYTRRAVRRDKKR